MAGQRDRFLADAFLQAAVADEGVGVVVDHARAETRAQPRLGHRHAQRVGDALAERPVVTSMPEAGSISGWPSQREPKSRKR
jgi:hypothetical protein